MSRYSPQVLPYAAPPIDFSPISNSLREMRERRRQERLEEQERQRYDTARHTEETRYATRQEQEAEARAADLLSKGMVRSQEYRDPSLDAVRATGAAVDVFGTGSPGVPVLQADPTLRRRSGMEAQRLEVDNQEWVFDPILNLRRRREEITTERAATKQGEVEGKYNAALEAGVAPDQARRWAFGPGGLTLQERQSLDNTQTVNDLKVKAYEYGQRAQLQKQRESAAYKLLLARQSGNPAATKVAMREYEIAKDALARADAENRYYESLIPKDPMRYQDALENPEFAGRIKEAEEWVKGYRAPGGTRAGLVQKVETAGQAAVGGGAPAAAGPGDTRIPIPRARYDLLVKQFGQARVSRQYRPE